MRVDPPPPFLSQASSDSSFDEATDDDDADGEPRYDSGYQGRINGGGDTAWRRGGRSTRSDGRVAEAATRWGHGRLAEEVVADDPRSNSRVARAHPRGRGSGGGGGDGSGSGSGDATLVAVTADAFHGRWARTLWTIIGHMCGWRRRPFLRAAIGRPWVARRDYSSAFVSSV